MQIGMCVCVCVCVRERERERERERDRDRDSWQPLTVANRTPLTATPRGARTREKREDKKEWINKKYTENVNIKACREIMCEEVRMMMFERNRRGLNIHAHFWRLGLWVKVKVQWNSVRSETYVFCCILTSFIWISLNKRRKYFVMFGSSLKLVNLPNYCSDDIDVNMKSCILYMVYSAHLWRFQVVLVIIRKYKPSVAIRGKKSRVKCLPFE